MSNNMLARAIRARSTIAWFAMYVVAITSTLAAQADAIATWNRIAADTINTPAGTFPAITDEEKRPIYSADLASVNVAMYDAVNAIVRSHTPYAIRPHATTRGASPEAAAGAAACRVLYGLYPSRAPRYEAACAPFLANSPGTQATLLGIAVGVEVGDGILQLRASDGRMTPATYDTSDAATGRFVPFPLTNTPVNVFQRFVRPFALRSADQFRAPGPPALGSPRYAADHDEVRRLGGAVSNERTAIQAEIARFHTEPPPVFWPRNLRQFSRNDRALADNARLLAALWVAHADASTACFESKYHYNFWRPRTAIPRADEDGNAATLADSTWTSFMPTPNHPDYPAAHSCVGAATAEILRTFLGNKHLHFSMDSNAFLAVDNTVHVHTYASTDELVADLSVARIYAGIHFRTATRDGARLGRDVAKWVTQRFFQPLPRRHEHSPEQRERN